jgi:Holliday junction resolvase
MTETEIQKQIVDSLEILGWMVIRQNAGGRGYNIKRPPPGFPDLIALSPNGETLIIEVKTEKGKVSEVQEKMHDRLKNMGQRVIIARCLDDVMEII